MPTIDRTAGRGASPHAIQAHYDRGNEFFRLWLDESMTYSCASWRNASSLFEAQVAKLDLHAQLAGAVGASRVLDVGCGWGALLKRLVRHHGVRCAVGLTLSPAQADYIKMMNELGVHVAVEGWRDHSPSEPYDAIISIGALEHFVRPEMSREERIAEYREFFDRCRGWLKPGGAMSLQTIAYGVGQFTHGAVSSIFPESDLPTISQLAEAVQQSFEIVSLNNDRLDYVMTCRAWLERLRARREEAVQVVGSEVVDHYEAFLAASARGFDASIFCLLRMRLLRL